MSCVRACSTLIGVVAVACALRVPTTPTRSLATVRAWAAQLQAWDNADAVDHLEQSEFDLLVLEPLRSQRDHERFPVRPLVHRLQRSRGGAGADKLCLAYLNVGQAEEYRSYFAAGWQAPAHHAAGTPDFLLTTDPDGWVGNYPVAYWDPRWRAVLWGHPDAPLDQVLADGFDGVYLDWILGYGDPDVRSAAQRAGIDPERAMVDLIEALRAYARSYRPGFLVVAQNAIDLVERQPRALAAIDGLAQEDLSFAGSAAASWGDPASGDRPAPSSGPWSTAALGVRLAAVAARGVPVFTLDYSCSTDNAESARRTSRSFGLIPFVSRAPLDRLPQSLAGPPVPGR